MTLFIAIILINQFDLHWTWTLAAVVVWILHLIHDGNQCNCK